MVVTLPIEQPNYSITLSWLEFICVRIITYY